MTELEELESIYCDLHKDVYGVKARWYRAESIEQAREDLAALQAAGERIWAQEEQEQFRAIANLELKITELIAMGAGDRATAIRWLHDANETHGDDEYLCFCLGIPYGYFNK